MGQRGEIGPFFPSPQPSPSRGEGAKSVVPRLTRPPNSFGPVCRRTRMTGKRKDAGCPMTLVPDICFIGEPSGMTEREALLLSFPFSHLSFPPPPSVIPVSPTCHSRRQLAGIQGLFFLLRGGGFAGGSGFSGSLWHPSPRPSPSRGEGGGLRGPVTVSGLRRVRAVGAGRCTRPRDGTPPR